MGQSYCVSEGDSTVESAAAGAKNSAKFHHYKFRKGNQHGVYCPSGQPEYCTLLFLK